MDMEVFGVDDLLDLSNDEFFTSSTSSTSTTTTTATITTTDSDHQHHQFSYTDNTTTAANATYFDHTPHNYNNYSPTNFTDHLCVPNDDIAELEWLSNFVDDSFSEFPAYSIIGTMNVCSETTLNSRSRSKRSQSTTWTENNKTNRSDDSDKDLQTSINRRKRTTSSTEILPRKCTHCSSEKTPQWRTGPLGPKTLCNACGVRYKSGRLVPEYRPAASPTFVLTQHSNSHRKVLELRRQKELFTGAALAARGERYP